MVPSHQKPDKSNYEKLLETAIHPMVGRSLKKKKLSNSNRNVKISCTTFRRILVRTKVVLFLRLEKSLLASTDKEISLQKNTEKFTHPYIEKNYVKRSKGKL